jgi:hypothetical protein
MEQAGPMIDMRQAGPLHIEGGLFLDTDGREIILRGVNLGGDCKLPWPNGATHIPSDFADHRTVSFIGRPFPLDEADAHLGRIAGWGFNCLRLLTTWEAVEHAGPGSYDTAYLDYLEAVARRAGDFGLHVFIDFHQDAWSRMSGGSGAPGWTFEAVGLDFTRFPQADAAIVMQAAMDFDDGNPHQPGYPQMIWSSNYLAPANGIMWTLFWMGRVATPDFRIDGENVQDYLQRHYLGAVEQVARRMRDLPCVIGFDTLNEPGTGWVGVPLSARNIPPGDGSPRPLKPGPAWSPLDCLAVAQGQAQILPYLTRASGTTALTVAGERACNPDGVRIWRDDTFCPFEAAGIYAIEDGRARPLREDAFLMVDGAPVALADHCYAPFFARVAATIRQHRSDWLLFAEMDPYALAQYRLFPAEMPANSINASHWYDVGILYAKRVDDTEGDGRKATYRDQLSGIKQVSRLFGAPTLIGEFGIPYDLDGGAAYRHWAAGDRSPAVWCAHETSLAAMYDVLDELLIHSAQWNYTASNRNDPWIGDGWNQEDLSIYSHDQSDGPDAGARARRGFDRPFVRAAQGRIVSVRFGSDTGAFEAVIDVDPAIARGTEIHLPTWLYPQGHRLTLSDEDAIVSLEGARTLRVTARRSGHLAISLCGN